MKPSRRLPRRAGRRIGFLGALAPPGRFRQDALSSFGQTEPPEILPPQIVRAGSAEKTVEACRRGRVDEVTELRIRRTQLIHQLAIALQVVLLVIVLSTIETIGWQNLDKDLPVQTRRHLLPSLGGQALLFLASEEDGRHVLTAPRRTGRVLAGEEEIEQLAVGDSIGIKIELHRLSVVTEVMVGGLRFGATGVAHSSPDDRVETPEPGVRSPESSQGESRGLDSRRNQEIDRRAWGG